MAGLMAKFQVGKGIDGYIKALGVNLDEIHGTCGRAVFDGAKIVADTIKSNIDRLPVLKSEWYSAENQTSGVTARQKQGLQDGFGIAPMVNDDGYYNVKVGFHGYNSQKTWRYPEGQPNAMIARAVEGGTSFRRKHPFVAPAIRKSRAKAERAIQERIERRLKEIHGG